MRKVCRHGKLVGSLGSVLGGCGDGLRLGWESRWLLEVPWDLGSFSSLSAILRVWPLLSWSKVAAECKKE